MSEQVRIQYPGQELFNWPAPIGYGVTSMPVNLPAFFGMGDRYWSSNFGRETQHNIYSGGYDMLTYYLAKHPEMAQTDPLLTQATGFKLTPYSDFFAAEFANTLASLQAKLESILKSDKLNDSQRTRLQEQLNKVKSMKEKIEKALKKNPSVEECLNMKASIKKLAEEIGKVGSEIAKEIEDAADADDDSDTDTDIDTDIDSDTDTDIDNDIDSDADDYIDTSDANPVSNKIKNEAIDICKNIYDGAVGSIGTDYTKIGAQGIDKLTKDNVITVLRYWADQYQPLSGDDNIVETIFDEEMLWNTKENTGYIQKIFNALEARAKELKVYDKLAGQFTVAADELDDTFVNEKKVKTAFEIIFKTVEEAEIAHNKKEAVKVKADRKKQAKEKAKAEKEAKAKAKAEEKETKARETFLADMKDIWKDEEAEISEKVQYENGKFKVRIEGKDYSADSFKALADKIEKAGYDPELYLKKRQLDKAA